MRNFSKLSYAEVKEREISSGVRHDDIFLDFRLGMTHNEYWRHHENLKNQNKIREIDNWSVYTFYFGDQNKFLSAGSVFYAQYFEDKLFSLTISVEPNDQMPRNKLLKYLVDIYKKKYGNDFITKPSQYSSSTDYIWIDGNRQITVSAESPNVFIFYVDLIANEKKERIERQEDEIKHQNKINKIESTGKDL